MALETVGALGFLPRQRYICLLLKVNREYIIFWLCKCILVHLPGKLIMPCFFSLGLLLILTVFVEFCEGVNGKKFFIQSIFVGKNVL